MSDDLLAVAKKKIRDGDKLVAEGRALRDAGKAELRAAMSALEGTDRLEEMHSPIYDIDAWQVPLEFKKQVMTVVPDIEKIKAFQGEIPGVRVVRYKLKGE